MEGELSEKGDDEWGKAPGVDEQGASAGLVRGAGAREGEASAKVGWGVSQQVHCQQGDDDIRLFQFHLFFCSYMELSL